MTSKDEIPNNPEYYKRILPEGCISMCSTEGKTVFKEALLSGHMDCYYKLVAQFRTQAESAFCGLTSLVMVLNALETDPGKIWKDPWRWYDEGMLECCNQNHVRTFNGVTFDQFVCLASCNYLDTNPTRVDDTASEETFRNLVTDLSSREDAFLILSYSRKTLGQNGDGHFSPLGGYHPDRDLILVMDTARFKYPPHWVPLSAMWEAMKSHDISTEKSRGYCLLSKVKMVIPYRLFSLSTSFSVFLPCACTSYVSTFVRQWKNVLAKNIMPYRIEVNQKNDTAVLSDVSLLTHIIPLLLESADYECLITTCLPVGTFSEERKKAKDTVVRQIESLSLYSFVRGVLWSVKYYSGSSIGQDGVSACSPSTSCDISDRELSIKRRVVTADEDVSAKCTTLSSEGPTPAHFITVLILCWPYALGDVTGTQTFGNWMENYVSNLMESITARELKEEVAFLKRQLSVLLEKRSENEDQFNGVCRIPNLYYKAQGKN